MTAQTFFGGSNVNQSYLFMTATGYYAMVPGTRTGTTITTEAILAQKIAHAGVLSDMGVNISMNTYPAATTLYLRKATANGNQTISVTGATTGQFQDVTNTDSVSAGDLLDYSVAVTAFTFQDFRVAIAAILFEGTTEVATMWRSEDSQPITFNGGVASTTLYVPVCGTGDNSNGYFVTAEVDAKTRISADGTFSRLGVYITTNTSTNAMTLTWRSNGADGNQNISIGASSTGYIEDTTNSDTQINGDDLSAKAISGAGTVNALMAFLGSCFESLATNWDMRSATTRVSAYDYSAGSSNYLTLVGSPFPKTAEANVQMKFPLATYLDRFTICVTAATGTSTVTAVVRKNGADGNGSLSLTGATTGTYEDATHVDAIAVNDLVNIHIPALGASSFVARYMGVRADTTSPSPSTPKSVSFVAT